MKMAILLSLVVFLMAMPLVSATPVIENITVSPSPNLWLGEDAVISLECSDSGNNSIEKVYAYITGPGIDLTPNGPKDFKHVNDNIWTLLINSIDLDRTGQFNATIYCKNSENNITTNYTSFIVSELIGYISAINPNPAYFEDIIEIDFIVKKIVGGNETKLSSGVVFNVSLDGKTKNLKSSTYDSNKGWILKLNSPTTSDVYDVKVIAFYNRTNVTDYSSVDVRNSIEFSIESIDKNWVKTGDNITVTLKALDKGSIITLDKSNVDIRINSIDAEITTISQRGNLFDVKFIAPSISSGRYQLDAYLDYESSYYSDSEPIDYIVSLSGSLIDENNRAINVQMKFIQNDVTKLTLTTDAYGHYSGSLPPDTYDLEIAFPKSTIYLYGAAINSFNDPVKHYYSDETSVSGIRNAGLHDYEIDLSYSNAEIEMMYTEKNIINENNLRVFRCSSWNSGRNTCNDDWTEVIGEIDIVRNRVKVTSSTLSAFVIGETKDITVDFSLDKGTYYLGDMVNVRGIAKDNDGQIVGNASISAYIKNKKDYNAVADENGVFSIEIPTPEEEGEYTVVLKARKYPYEDFKDEKDFKVVKSRSVLIDFPDTVKIARGGNLSQKFDLLNNGQANIENIEISLEGLPESYYTIASNSIDLKPDEKKTMYIDFSIPVYADPGISSVTLKVENGNITEEKVFGLNIFETSSNETAPTGLATGFALPQINYMDIVYIVIFAAVCFSAAIILKKRKVSKKKAVGDKSFLSDVGKYIKRDETQVIKPQGTGSYDKLIITEFPNVMKFSKGLTKNKGDE